MRGLYSEVGSVTEFHYCFTLAAEVRIGSIEKGGNRDTS